MNTPVVAEVADNALHVILQFLLTRGVFQNFLPGTLHPPGVVPVGIGLALLAGLGKRVPNTVEQDEHHTELVFLRDAQEMFHAPEQTPVVLLPNQIMQKNADAREAEVMGPAEFAVNGIRIPSVGLPHFELVDGGAGREVAPDEPRLFCIPHVGLFRRPLDPWRGAVARSGLATEERQEQQKRAKSFHGLEMIWSAIRFHRFFKRDARMTFLVSA